MTSDQELLAKIEDTLAELLKFPLMEALIGRRSRRFCMGSEIPDGVLAFKSKHKPMQLSEVEQLLLLSIMAGGMTIVQVSDALITIYHASNLDAISDLLQT
jgi:hypothetical protein